jgi:hypothetical protein
MKPTNKKEITFNLISLYSDISNHTSPVIIASKKHFCKPKIETIEENRVLFYKISIEFKSKKNKNNFLKDYLLEKTKTHHSNYVVF